jgi:hypothetical protein
MPLVFVHGVKTRQGPGYVAGVAARDALFKQFLGPIMTVGQDGLAIENPFWGDLGASFAWKLGSVPKEDGDLESLGATAATPYVELAQAALINSAATGTQTLILDLARRDFGSAVDLLFTAAAHTSGLDVDEYGRLAVRAAEYVELHPAPDWINSARTDNEFVSLLMQEIKAAPQPTETLGGFDVWNRIREGMDRVHDAAANAIGGPLWEQVRSSLLPTVVTFVGDAFAYQTHRGSPQSPGAIPGVVLGALSAAASHRTEHDPYLVVVCHSMGGVITYDLLSGYAPDVTVDVLITVGSQVGLLEELKLLTASDTSVTAPARVAVPQRVRSWINVFDLNDILSYLAEPIFDRVTDYRFATGNLVTAHTSYFAQPTLHSLLAERVRSALATLADP